MRAEAAGGVTNLDVSLFVNGQKQADTWINLSEGGSHIEIPGSPVLFALTPLLDKDALHRLDAAMDSKGMFSNTLLARFGISLTFNGLLQQVNLGLIKDMPKTGPSHAPAREAGKIAAGPRAKVPADSGPWTTPPTPALPGERDKPVALKSPAADSSMPHDNGWEIVADTLKPKAAVPVILLKPRTVLQSYQLDRTRDELFEDVFKHKPPPLPASVEVTLLVDGKSYGTLWINYSNELKRYTFPVDPVLNALQGLVKRDLWEKLARRANSQNRFTVEDLIECGFPTVLNTSVFELSTGVPAQLLGTKIHPMSGRIIDPYAVPVFEASGLSGFLNTRVKERLPYYQYNPSPYDSAGSGLGQVESRNRQTREPLITNFDGAVNLKTWVVEGKAILWEQPTGNSFEASRQDIRLVHDWPRHALRLSAGDLIFPTSGFQSFLNMGGVGLSRDFSLQPHLVAYPVKDFEFFLTNPSEVKIYVNGTLKGTYQLDQGTHDLQGFPFTAGESEVEIQITDNTGQTQTLNFDFIHEPSLLAAGNSAFSYNVGYPSRDIYNVPVNLLYEPDGREVLNYEYDLGHPVVFLDYKRGMTNLLTMEAYSQALDTAGMVGLDVLQAMKIGKIKADVAGSYHQGMRFDWAGNLEYTYIPKITSNVSPVSWRLRTEYIGPKFFRPGEDPGLFGSLTFAGSYQKNAIFANFNLGAAYTMRPDSADFYDVYLTLSRNWTKGWSSSLSLKNVFDRQRFTNTSVAATLNYYFNVGMQTLNASERAENHRPDGTEKGPPPSWDYSTDLMWDYNGSAPFPHNPSLSATTSFGPASNDYSGTAEWNGNQGTAQILGRRYEPKTSSIITNYADLTLQTALVYADGNFALSRPITNSFVMVKGIENEKVCDILVNPNEMGYDAKASTWLPGVVANVSPYNLKKIHLEVQDPPFGSSDERSDYTIYPGYKSGYALYMGTSATIIALGTLLLAPGVPVEYQTFKATAMDGKPQDPIMGFTNGAGKFQLTRLQPGRYRIETEVDGKEYSLILTLPKKTFGIKSVGTLILAPK